MRSQIIVVFIIEHNIVMNFVSLVPWRLYFVDLVCSNGQGFGIAFIVGIRGRKHKFFIPTVPEPKICAMAV